MSISSVAGGATANWPHSVRQAKSTSTTGDQADDAKLAPGMNADAPYDAINVDLPNGMSVGVVSFGSAGLGSATLKAIEDFVQKFANRDVSGHQVSGTDGATARSGANGGSNVVGLDKIHVDLPNGISFEVRHSSGGQAADSAAIMKELTDAAEQLADDFGKYSPASTAATKYANNQAALYSRANQVDTQT
ncbi:hypothetical protein [Bradyrhizobium uaiense]|uniref:Uncharacterized protein n=1 Tax=Bradyrhizobium uaiense TaxID=2594946 RepID=A0A6P1BSK1_9BRAD|nr:hypothetical protein [Bradyrhizobium uaiense]NEV00651.1 hypothetical protein [Bradyrhizobium uaiense]